MASIDQTDHIAFVRDFLKRLQISSTIVTDPTAFIPPEIDLGLRNLLFGIDNYVPYLANSMSQAKDRTIYRFFDEYRCHYLFLRLPGPNDSYFFMGPYLLSLPDEEQITRKADSLSLTGSLRKQFFLYYSGLPIIEDENWLMTLANTLGSRLWGASDEFSLEYVDYMIPDRNDPIPVVPSDADPADDFRSLSVLEKHYANEKLLMDAVSKGKLHLVTAAASSVFNNGTESRLSDSLRNRKNYLIILNTLLRKAAEHGGVHPLHIDRHSSRYAREIEQTRSIKQSLHLQEEMIRSYCLLVKHHSLSQYSYYVARAITLIHYDLTADLSLRAVSAQLNVNPGYLSGLFHKECGCTITEFVNRQRIERAILLLRNTDKLIQDISAECGFHDTNYFIRLFKKQTGISPAKYRTEHVTK